MCIKTNPREGHKNQAANEHVPHVKTSISSWSIGALKKTNAGSDNF